MEKENKFMNVVIHSNESLVFRDGRPFGSEGQLSGGVLRWPNPFTVTGLLRSNIGISREPDYFSGVKQQQNIEAIKKVTVKRILPLWQASDYGSEWKPLFPAPADAMIFPSTRENHYIVDSFTYESAFTMGGVDLPWKNWLLPGSSRCEKPASESPELWSKTHFFNWLETGAFEDEVSAIELGFNLPQPELRIHSAIDSTTFSTKTGHLFSSQGIQLITAGNERQLAGRLGIGVTLSDLKEGDDPCGPCFFGGERKTAIIDKVDDFMPPAPEWFNPTSRYLRLILITPGDFGSWAPDWLRPDPEESETTWRTIPTGNMEIRLVSAFIPRWFPVSGWDYDKRGPKATRKLVPAGAVYIIELKEPEMAGDVARLLWGKSMNSNLSDPNGSGCICVGNLTI
ncbi:MAG: hypothetical protein HQK65_04595 [Desulfamplus sp.]|nr:hypothetical protein [Desulfamplus sp.]